MNQVEIIKAILAGDVLDIKFLGEQWDCFNSAATPVERTLRAYISNYEGRYELAEFRIRPKVKTYQSRAYIDNEGGIFHWVSTGSLTQDETINAHGYWARWIEETQTKEYV
jgi:hypothetical protein